MEDLTAKVGDFGLSKRLDMEKYNCYVQKEEVIFIFSDLHLDTRLTLTLLWYSARSH